MQWLLTHSDDVGKLLLRVSIAAFILVYGIEKLTNPAMMEYIRGLLVDIGVPGFVAYGVYFGEIIAPLMLLIGWRTRFAAAAIAGTMVVVILLGHWNEIFPLANFSWWGIELQTLFLLNSIAVLFLGAGKFAASTDAKWD